MTYKVSATFPLDDDDAVTALVGVDPRATYNPGAERVTTLAGIQVFLGYPRATWTFTALTVEQWEDLRDLLTAYSGEVYIETRDDVDAWAQYRALAHLPEPRTLQRWGGRYRDVTLEFVLLEDVTPSEP